MNEQDATTSTAEKPKEPTWDDSVLTPKEPLWLDSLLMFAVLVSLAAFAVGVFEHSWLLIFTGAVSLVVCWATNEYVSEG